MSNKFETAPAAKTPVQFTKALAAVAKAPAKTRNRKGILTISFQKFGEVFLAKISDQKGRHTFAYGTRKCQAQLHALRNYRLKYLTPYFKM